MTRTAQQHWELDNMSPLLEKKFATSWFCVKSVVFLCNSHCNWLAGVQLTTTKNSISPGGRFNKKISSYQYRKSHCGDKTILRPSYLHNAISYTGKMTSLYWIRALMIFSTAPNRRQVIIRLQVLQCLPFQEIVRTKIHSPCILLLNTVLVFFQCYYY